MATGRIGHHHHADDRFRRPRPVRRGDERGDPRNRARGGSDGAARRRDPRGRAPRCRRGRARARGHGAVIDPGVGTARRGIAVAARDQVFIGPDNGVFTPFLSGRDWRAFELAVPAYRLPAVSRTFHGRDLFAPAAAHVAVGVDVARLGPALTDPVRLAWDRGRERAGTIEGAVIHVDRFGNLVTSLFADALRPGSVVRVAGRTIPVVGTYGDLPRGGLGALAGSSGRLEIAVREGSAAAVLRARRGTRVIVSRTSSSRTSSSGTSPSGTSPSQISSSRISSSRTTTRAR